MNPSEVISFLLPEFSDPLQVGFFALILLMMAFTIVSAHLRARPASWERKWNRGTPDDCSDDLDIEHGSVTDLWHAIATAPEKLAEIMPGMLLVVGLLGTFLGLGLALNHASSILGQANALSASGAANSMQDLLGLLQGLGTKFKTSTWGITGFVLLKIWSELTRFEEKRLTWVIAKVKSELEHRKKDQAAAEAAKQEVLYTQIRNAASSISQAIAEQTAQQMERDKASHQHALHVLERVVKGVREDLVKIHAETRGTATAMVQFTESTQGVVENMAEASQRMASGADKIGDAADQLVGTINEFQAQFTDVLDKVGKDLGSAIDKMSIQAAETLERGSTQLGEATREISTALGVLSADVKETMGEVQGVISRSLEIQEKTSRRFIESNDALTENINKTTTVVEKLGMPIEEGLRSVSESGQHMRGIGKSLDKSIRGMEDVVAQLIQLPAALEPLRAIPENQHALVSALKPLGTLPAQQIILQDLHSLLVDIKSRKAAAESPNAELA
jgi:methyl-accepting chemotaxis protein